MRLHLVAVQAALQADAFIGPDAFAAWVLDLARQGVAGAPPDVPVLLAFPELVALPLTFTLAGGGSPPPAGATLLQAGRRSLRRDWPGVARAALRHAAFGPAAVHLARARAVHRVYLAAFAAAARDTGATVVAGSALLPELAVEDGDGARPTGSRVHNVAYVLAPSGALLGRARKVHLTPGLEARAGLARGRLADLPVMQAGWGKLGVAVCLDGWREDVLAHLDALGAQVVVQPSANDASWDRPWPQDPRLSEGEAWLTRGLSAGLRGRASLRYGLNPMLVGELLGFAPRGRSSIVTGAASGGPWCEGRRGVLALASSSDAEEVVSATVELVPEPPVAQVGGRMRP